MTFSFSSLIRYSCKELLGENIAKGHMKFSVKTHDMAANWYSETFC